MVRILTDSTSDISPDAALELGVTVVPLWVNFGEKSYLDRIDIKPEEFYQKLVSGKVFPTSSTPPAGAFAEAYDKLAEETDEVLALILSSRLSATYEAAIEGLELRRRKDCRIEVVDVLSTATAQALLVMLASEEARQGASLIKIKDTIERAIPKTHIRVCFDTLEYLRRGGRIGTAQALMGSLLKINPVVGVIDGVIEGIARARSREKALDWLYNFAEKFKNIRMMAVAHTTVPDEAEALAQRLGAFFPVEKIHRLIIGPSVGSHVGPMAVSVALVEQI